jgi:TolA-binding protein
MSKTIKQIADEIGVSKQAVTKCIDNLGLRSLLTKNGNCFLIENSQEKAIKSAFATHKNNNQSANQNSNQSPTELSKIISVLQSTINTLQIQITTKDEQIKAQQQQLVTKDEQLRQLTVAMENTTAALTAAQILHAGTIREQLTLAQNQTEETPITKQKKKFNRGFLKRMFGKNNFIK